MSEFFIESFFRGVWGEILVAVLGLLYLRKVPSVPFYKKLFVYYLCGMLLVDLSGYYVAIAYFTDYRWFGFVENTVWDRNYWLFNAVNPISFLVFLWFFIAQLKSKRIRQWFKIATALFLIGCVIFNIISGDYFTSYIPFTYIAGSILLAICIAFYFIQVLQSDQIIDFYKTLSFYVAFGALLWHLGFTPMFIYNNYNIMESTPVFLEIYKITLSILNFIMYGSFAAGFIIEMRTFKKSGKVISS